MIFDVKNSMNGSNVSEHQTDCGSEISELFESCLGDTSKLASRIVDAARLAAAYHMLVKAQDMQSTVEAENSTI